jgi:hypothetical protein
MNFRTFCSAIALLLTVSAAQAASLNAYIAPGAVTQSAPYKQVSFRFSQSFEGIIAVEGRFAYDPNKFSVYSVTSIFPHQCRYLQPGLIEVSAPYNSVSNTQLPNSDFCQVWLKLKPSVAAGNSVIRFPTLAAYNNVGNTVPISDLPSTVVIQ